MPFPVAGAEVSAHTAPVAETGYIEFLETQITPARRDRFRSALAERTRYITVVLEDIYQHHNANAVARSCEAFGLQDLHVVENGNPFRVDRNIARGAFQWIDIHRYRSEDLDAPGTRRRCARKEAPDTLTAAAIANTRRTFAVLRDKGYKLVATAIEESPTDIADLSLDQPVALIIGNELRGLTQVALEEADERVVLPMAGLTTNLNLSVFTALCLYDLTKRLRISDLPWQLTEEEQIAVHRHWLETCISHAKEKWETHLALQSPAAGN